MEIKDKVAVVTGGASGLGRAIIEKIVAAGGRAAIFDMNEEAGTAFAKEMGDAVMYQSVNVTDEASVQRAINNVVNDFGAIHICVNCAGIGNAAKTFGRKGVFPLESFTQVINVNLIGTFNVLRLAAEKMAANEPVNEDGERGVIINTASVAAYEGQVGQAAYSASKGGIVGMTLPIARDLASYGIRVNTMVPGLINTPLFNGLPQESIDALSSTVLYPKRLGKPSEIAHLAATLIENGYINGECIRMDGGIRMQPH
ncbi:MAG: NAD(P)-dependent dehydrogenase (short-subunit alcohol dehydrogenase family) [Oceanicoccus sp.]|jgi:NAD(P)-dependent dehydrogenase (short-subunit alcohol dehydrogenase family)